MVEITNMNYTPIHNRFWSDGWIRQLNALDRYLFIYLLTNGRSQCTGIYELPLDMMATECGIDEKDLRISMLQRLEPKIYYKEGWIIIMNFIKHRVSDSPALIKGIQNEFEELPPHIKEIAIKNGYPLHTLPIPSRSRVEKSRVENPAVADSSIRIEKTDNEGDVRERKVKDDAVAKYESLLQWAEERRGFKFTNRTKQYVALKKARLNDISMSRLKDRWTECEGETWRDGFDWTSVVSSYDKKA